MKTANKKNGSGNWFTPEERQQWLQRLDASKLSVPQFLEEIAKDDTIEGRKPSMHSIYTWVQKRTRGARTAAAREARQKARTTTPRPNNNSVPVVLEPVAQPEASLCCPRCGCNIVEEMERTLLGLRAVSQIANKLNRRH